VSAAVGAAAGLGCQRCKNGSSFSPSEVSLLHVVHRYFSCLLAQQSDWQYSFTSLFPISEKILVVLTAFSLKLKL